MDLETESYLLHRLLYKECQDYKYENEHSIDKTITTNIISTKIDDDKVKDKENSSISKEEINNESSFTEENALKDLNFFANDDIEEKKEKPKFLAKKRKLKTKENEFLNLNISETKKKKAEITFEEEDNIQNDSNQDGSSEDDYGNLSDGITFEYKVESDDDEACI